MCIGGGSVVQSSEVDTSTQPIVSKYPLNASQKAENKRRRSLLASRSAVLGVGDGGYEGVGGSGTSGGGYGGGRGTSNDAYGGGAVV